MTVLVKTNVALTVAVGDISVGKNYKVILILINLNIPKQHIACAYISVITTM